MILYQLLQIFAAFSLFSFEPSSSNETRTLSPGENAERDRATRDPMLWLQHNVCTIRYSFRAITTPMFNCSRVIERNPICGRDITVVYSLNPPYAMEVMNRSTGLGTRQHKGILFGKN